MSNEVALRQRASQSPWRFLSDPASQLVATGAESAANTCRLLTVQEVAELLQVPGSRVYARTRKRSVQALPHIKLGKYIRFEESAITEFIRRQRCA